MPTPMQPTETPDLAALERDLRGWSWATGGWASLHAVGGLVMIASGALAAAPNIALRLAIIVLVTAWTTTAIGSWQFRRSFHAKVGIIAATASIVAGLVMGTAGLVLVRPEAIVDGIAHLLAGVGLMRAVRQARPLLYFT